MEKRNFDLVKELLLQATVYVYEDKQEIQGFVGLSDEYIEGIFRFCRNAVSRYRQNFVKLCKGEKKQFTFKCISKNARAISFIKEKGLKSSAMALMKLPGKEIMQWHGNGK